MTLTNPELAAIYRTEAARTTHKKWADTLLMWAERLEPMQISLF